MDTPTQALLGAVIGQACFSRKLGTRALWWGVAGAAIPDLDLFPAELLSPWGEFLYHRGPTHSLWFGIFAGPVCGFLAWKWYGRRRRGARQDSAAGLRQRIGDQITDWSPNVPRVEPSRGSPGSLLSWTGLFFLVLVTHPLLDLFTSYGTQLLWPFSNHRFALQGVSIIDPAYSLVLIAALLTWVLLPTDKRILRGRQAAWLALLFSTGYLFYGLRLNHVAEGEVRSQLRGEGLEAAEVTCYPTIFQPFLRRVVVRSDSEIRVGLLSVWRPCPIEWQRFAVIEHPLIEKLLETEEGKIFTWFAMGQVAGRVIPQGEGFRVEIDDLRYGFYTKPDEGLWGMAALFDSQGNQVSRVLRYRRDYPPLGETLSRLWRDTFGLSCRTTRETRAGSQMLRSVLGIMT